MSLVNIAKNAKVTFSSTSKWSTDNDNKEIVNAEHNRDYSFHSDLEQNPWVELDLGTSYALDRIVVFNIKKKVYQIRANTLQVAISEDKLNYEVIHQGFIAFQEKIEFNLDSLKKARYVKLSLEGLNYFHLSKIEIYIDESKNSGLIFDKRVIPDKIKFHAFYIGSCRYMGLFPKHFPARLHTTKEIINFLNNYNKIDSNMVDVNYIYGDLLHPVCKKDSITYCNNMDRIFNSVTTIFLEITSRKYILNNGVVYNNYYYNYYNKKNDKETKIINDDELFSDLLHIKFLLKSNFGINSIVVIPHIDLLLDNGEKIVARDNLKTSLEKICKILNIKFLDINKAFPEGSYFKDIAPDSKHYSEKGNSIVWPYINNYLNNFILERADVLDCKYQDEGTLTYHNDNFWTSWENYPRTITRKSEYTEVTQTNTGTTGYLIFPFNNLSPAIIEFDFYKNGGSLNETIIQLRNDKREILRGIPLVNINNALKLNTWYHIKLDFENNKIYVGDYSVPMNTTNATNLYIACMGTTKSIRYKNFKIYSI